MLPIAHSNAAAKPLIQTIKQLQLRRQAEVTHPAGKRSASTNSTQETGLPQRSQSLAEEEGLVSCCSRRVLRAALRPLRLIHELVHTARPSWRETLPATTVHLGITTIDDAHEVDTTPRSPFQPAHSPSCCILLRRRKNRAPTTGTSLQMHPLQPPRNKLATPHQLC